VIRSAAGFIALLLPFLFVGCGDGYNAVVSGTVEMDGAPLEAADIKFTPDGTKGTKGPAAIGMVENGKYKLFTGAKDTVPVGHYIVTISCPFRLDAGSSESGSPVAKSGKCNIPKKYGDTLQSGLAVEVKAGSQEIPLTITSK